MADKKVEQEMEGGFNPDRPSHDPDKTKFKPRPNVGPLPTHDPTSSDASDIEKALQEEAERRRS